MIHPRGLDAAALSPPRHYYRIRGETALQDLVPADHASILRRQEPLDPPNEVALQLVLVFQSFPLQDGLRLGTLPPAFLLDLVTADVDVRDREHFDDFA